MFSFLKPESEHVLWPTFIPSEDMTDGHHTSGLGNKYTDFLKYWYNFIRDISWDNIAYIKIVYVLLYYCSWEKTWEAALWKLINPTGLVSITTDIEATVMSLRRCNWINVFCSQTSSGLRWVQYLFSWFDLFKEQVSF